MTTPTRARGRSKAGARKSPKKPTQPTPDRRAPRAATAVDRKGEGRQTKLQRLEAALRAPEGATIAALSRALDWQAHSVRGAISGTLRKKRGLTITSEVAEGGERSYRIAG